MTTVAIIIGIILICWELDSINDTLKEIKNKL
jgi:hypothetical protein